MVATRRVEAGRAAEVPQGLYYGRVLEFYDDCYGVDDARAAFEGVGAEERGAGGGAVCFSE